MHRAGIRRFFWRSADCYSSSGTIHGAVHRVKKAVRIIATVETEPEAELSSKALVVPTA
ncbi:hypothetical protein D3C75_1229110 [compost metagenome]